MHIIFCKTKQHKEQAQIVPVYIYPQVEVDQINNGHSKKNRYTNTTIFSVAKSVTNKKNKQLHHEPVPQNSELVP